MPTEQELEAVAKSKWQAFLDYTAKNPGFWTGLAVGVCGLLVLRGCFGV